MVKVWVIVVFFLCIFAGAEKTLHREFIVLAVTNGMIQNGFRRINTANGLQKVARSPEIGSERNLNFGRPK